MIRGQIYRRSKFKIDTSDSGKADRTFNGRVYASKMECEYARDLDLRERTKNIHSWEPQYRVPLVVGGIKICTMVIDFRVIHNDGTTEYVEVKGFETTDYKLKKKLLEALFPGIRYTVIKKR